MRVLHIITGLADGGAEAILYRLCAHNQQDVHVVISLRGVGKYGPMLGALGIRVLCLDIRPGFTAFRALVRLWRIIRTESPDVIQTWMYHADLLGGVIGRLAGCRRIYWGVHNTTLMPERSKRLTILIAHINALLSRWVPMGIVYCAERARQVHRELGYDDRRAVVIQNGYDIDVFHPNAVARTNLRRAWGVDDDLVIIGLVARLDPQKDHDNLFSALSILLRQGVNLCCVLVGAGLEPNNIALLSRLDAYGLKVGETVLLLGQRSDVPDIMNALDIHVLSSFSEAFPNVLCESMACGTPCVSTDVGDAAVILGDTGWIVPPARPEALAGAILEALHERTAYGWEKRQQRARQRTIEHFDVGKMVASYRQKWSTE